MTDKMIGHFEDKNENKYLVLDDTNENEKFQRNMKKLGKVIKKIETINGGERVEYEKDF